MKILGKLAASILFYWDPNGPLAEIMDLASHLIWLTIKFLRSNL